MNDNDKHEFLEFINDVYEYYRVKKPSPNVLKIQFEVLRPLSISQIRKSIYSYMRINENSQFLPKPGEIIKILYGKNLNSDEIIACARIAKTPLGILCRIQIGSWDLNNCSISVLRGRAQECIQKMDEWKNRAFLGDYTDREIRLMLKNRVDPTKPFHDGIEVPDNLIKLTNKIKKIGLMDNKENLYLEAN